MKEFVVSIKEGPNGNLVVVTDASLIGKKFLEKKIQLDLTSSFYKGDLKNKTEIKLLIESAKDFHITGEKSINLFEDLDLVDKKNIIYIKKIPHALITIV